MERRRLARACISAAGLLRAGSGRRAEFPGWTGHLEGGWQGRATRSRRFLPPHGMAPATARQSDHTGVITNRSDHGLGAPDRSRRPAMFVGKLLPVFETPGWKSMSRRESTSSCALDALFIKSRVLTSTGSSIISFSEKRASLISSFSRAGGSSGLRGA